MEQKKRMSLVLYEKLLKKQTDYDPGCESFYRNYNTQVFGKLNQKAAFKLLEISTSKSYKQSF